MEGTGRWLQLLCEWVSVEEGVEVVDAVSSALEMRLS